MDVGEGAAPRHRAGDMRTLRLGRTFDAVFVHDAVCYMRTEADLWRAMETAWVHCRPGGAVLFAPDYVRENFVVGATTGGCDEPPGSGWRGHLRARAALSRMGLGSGSARHGVPGRLRLPAARARRFRARGPGPPRGGAVPARPMAGAAGRRRFRGAQRAAGPLGRGAGPARAVRGLPAALSGRRPGVAAHPAGEYPRRHASRGGGAPAEAAGCARVACPQPPLRRRD